MRRRTWPAVIVAALVVVVSVLAVQALAQSPSPYVTRSGTKLMLGGKPWRFVGYNDYELSSIPQAYTCGGDSTDTATVDAVMQQAAASGATVIRTWFFQSFYDLDADGTPTTPSFAAFDRVLDAAAQYGLKVIPVLVNEFPECEPGSTPKDLSFFQSGYEQPGYGYPLSFKDYAATVAAHYADDPTIAFWEIGNELSDQGSGTCTASVERTAAHALRTFADTMTGTIKAADPNHLVALGTVGTGQCGESGTDYSYVYGGAVDICEYHDYGDVTHSIPSDGFNRLAQRIAQCKALHKPLFVGESGIDANVGDNGQPTGTISAASLDLRAGFFDSKLTAAFRAGVDGYVIWDMEQAQGEPPYAAPASGYQIGPGDPTLAVTATIARTFGAYPGTLESTFEDGGRDGWTPVAGAGHPRVANSTAEAWGGFHSLAITLGGGSHEAVALSYPAGVGGGSVVTLHVFLPENAPSGMAAAPSLLTRSGGRLTAAATTLVPGWNVLSWTVPGRTRSPTALELEPIDAGSWQGKLYLDDVAWSARR